MLAFGYAVWNTGSGNSANSTTHFVLRRGDRLQQCMARGQQVSWADPHGSATTLLDSGLQLAQDVEDARDQQGDPERVPLRCLHLPDDLGDGQIPMKFLAEYFNATSTDEPIEAFLKELMAGVPSDAADFVDWDESTSVDFTAPDLGGETEFTTPTGEPYIPRIVGGLNDVLVVRRAIEEGWTVGLAGEPGTGKTTLAQVAAPDLLQLTFNGETSVEDIIGRYNPDATAPSGFAWADGPLITAMREGLPFLADELPRAPQEVQSVFLSVCDHRRAYIDPANPNIGEIVAADGFAVLIAHNPGSGFGMPEALHDRIAFTITVPTDLDTAVKLGVPAPFITAARALAAGNVVAAAQGKEEAWVPTLRSLLKARDIAGVLGLPFAARALVSACPDPLLRGAVSNALEQAMSLGEGELGELIANS
ncbi:AAA family ATPase [Prescottella agglutinans]|uniref:ATPase dynein-related AAA domain-containing protein n=1 Tax=Prescottella agglutinans TaxID=1644129 RepID=A0ABT6MJ30_9NOCA|nr:AAA family ATPase [Prescottella agglutinans]MDH6284329.1 hypothetical protein [Prescottella agglutinans]